MRRVPSRARNFELPRFRQRCLLFRNHMIEAEHHHRIGITENLFVER